MFYSIAFTAVSFLVTSNRIETFYQKTFGFFLCKLQEDHSDIDYVITTTRQVVRGTFCIMGHDFFF